MVLPLRCSWALGFVFLSQQLRSTLKKPKLCEESLSGASLGPKPLSHCPRGPQSKLGEPHGRGFFHVAHRDECSSGQITTGLHPKSLHGDVRSVRGINQILYDLVHLTHESRTVFPTPRGHMERFLDEKMFHPRESWLSEALFSPGRVPASCPFLGLG